MDGDGEMWRKISTVLGIVFVLLVVALASGVGEQVGKAVFATDKTDSIQMQNALVKGFHKAARRINARVPIMVDKKTRMDGASVGPGPRLTYHYTLVGRNSDEIDITWLKTDVRGMVRSYVCQNKEMAPSLAYGVTYAYSYSGADGVKIAGFMISQNDCD